MDEAANIWRVADEIVRQLGDGAYAYLCAHTEIAKERGDMESAVAWWDIALATLEVLNERENQGLSRPTATQLPSTLPRDRELEKSA